ncbi:MAG: hypothetical protein LDLANPLL_01476 [Turneriella sp.]|nr:hypothetical protein [Turneriella sp.]
MNSFSTATITVDIVIPAYERIELLREAVESVLAQTHKNFFLYIVDDASPVLLEKTLKIIDPRISHLRLPVNSGPGIARNTGVQKGNAPFIAFLDSDDLWSPEKLSEQIAYMRENPTIKWVHTNEVWLRSGKVVKQKKEHRKEGGVFLERAFERCLISPSAVLLERKFFEQSGGFSPHFFLCEDYELWLRLLVESPVGFIDKALTIKRAGDWKQLSQTAELDRLRVLALHRFYRSLRHAKKNPHLTEPLLKEAEKKCRILLKGAIKYGNQKRAKEYQAWLTLLSTLRTRPIR